MFDVADPAAILVAQRQWIEKVAAITCRRSSVWGEDAEDFASGVILKIIEDDYAVLRKFRGDSDIRTYLATVVTFRFHEYARERWGRWRHSARAERMGPPARDLEALVHRDGYTLRQAIEVLRTSGRTTASEAELVRLFAELPPREGRPEVVGGEPLDALPAPSRADDAVTAAEVVARCRGVMAVLARVLGRLAPEDRILVRGRFGEGRSVADIARVLGREQAPLYKRSDRLRRELRRDMEAEGIAADAVRDCLALEDR
jgi:RNA polymerase sigma factor (sigma-70 family)